MLSSESLPIDHGGLSPSELISPLHANIRLRSNNYLCCAAAFSKNLGRMRRHVHGQLVKPTYSHILTTAALTKKPLSGEGRLMPVLIPSRIRRKILSALYLQRAMTVHRFWGADDIRRDASGPWNVAVA